MRNLVIQTENSSTPNISFSVNTNVFEFNGISCLENTQKFYRPVLKWLHQYLSSNKRPITVVFRFTYFSTAAYRSISDVLQLLECHHIAKKTTVTINWVINSNDSTLLKGVEFFKEDFKNLPFHVLFKPAYQN